MEQKPVKPFQHRYWAALIGLGGLFQIATPFILRDQVEYSPMTIAIIVITGIILLPAAAGFWLRRRWGLWLYLAAIMLSAASLIVTMIIEQSTTGAIQSMGWRIYGLFFALLALGVFYKQRDAFE